jgi:type II secretory pathway component PulK
VIDRTTNDEPKDQHRHQRGFVLVAVIWLAGLIAALTTGFVVKVRVDALTASNIVRNTQAELIADGMARLAAWRLATASQPTDTTRTLCMWRKGMMVEVLIQDQSGLADINMLPPIFLAELLRGLGADDQRAKEISEAMLDFRDGDSEAQSGGVEPKTYPERDFGPKNAPYEAIEELDQLPGMDEDLYRALLPLVTVSSSQAGIDPKSAPLSLRKAFNQSASGAFTGSLANFVGASQGRTFGLDVRVTADNGARYRRLATAIILRQPERPFSFLTWQRGDEWTEDKASARPTTSCFN